MKVLSVSTKKNPGSVNFCNSLKKFGFSYELLGVGEKWGGWRYRMQTYVNKLKTLPTDDIVILSDADDVLCVREFSGEFERRFRAFGTPVVIGGDATCAHHYNCKPVDRYWADKTPTKFQYVNAGSIAGFAGALSEMWQWVLDHGYTDDQHGLGFYVNSHPLNVVIDSHCKLFYVNPPPASLIPQGVFNWKENELISIDTQVLDASITPFFVHYAGNFTLSGVDNYFLGKTTEHHKTSYLDVGSKLLGAEALQLSECNSYANSIGVAIFWTIVGISIFVTFALVYMIYRYIKLKSVLKAQTKTIKTLKTK